MRPLRGGLKLEGKKEATTMPWTILRPSPPRRVRIPLVESLTDLVPQPLVGVGDTVRVGQRMTGGDSTSPGIHASVSGRVSAIENFTHPFLGSCPAIEIRSDARDEPVAGLGVERPLWESLDPSEYVRILYEGGVISLKPFLAYPVETVILNGCESEPYLTSDHCLMMSHPTEILRGGDLLRRALGADDLVIALEDNKEEVADLLKSKIFLQSLAKVRVEIFPARYPQGNEKLLIREILGREIWNGEVSSKVGAAVFDMATAFASYEAIVWQKPFYETAVTIGGECVAQPQNVWLRVGTAAEEAVKYARGFLRRPERIVLGGPMTGQELSSLEAPIVKRSRGLLGLPPEVVKPASTEPCIRCGRCLESCPVSISPALITLAAEKDLFELAEEYGARFCIECGNCAYVCPAKRPMVELIHYANAHG